MSQIYKMSSGGGGGGDLSTLTPDVGGTVTATAGNINVFGLHPSGTPIVTTDNIGNNLEIEDRTYITQYVVDSSTTPGSRGTFSTINAAITQATADAPALATIFIRENGTGYTENVVIPSFMVLTGLLEDNNSRIAQPRIIGNVTFASHCIGSGLFNIAVGPSAGNAVDITNCQAVSFQGCNFQSPTSAFAVFSSALTTPATIIFQDCRIGSFVSLTYAGTYSQVKFLNCNLLCGLSIDGFIIDATSGQLVIEECAFNGTNLIISGGSAAIISILNCYTDPFLSVSDNSQISGTGTSQLNIDGMTFINTTTVCITYTGPISAANITNFGASATFTLGLAPVPTPQFPGLSYTLLQTQTVTNVANVNFTSVINANYKNYKLVINNYQPINNTTNLQMQVSIDNGASYIATGYNSMVIYSSTAGVGSWANNTSTTFVYLGFNVDNTVNTLAGEYFLGDFQSGSIAKVNGTLTQFAAGIYYLMNVISAVGVANVNAFQITSSAGNIAQGTFSLYGLIQ